MLSQSGGERRKLNVRGKQNAIGNTKYTPVKLYCVICEMLPQYAMSQYAAYGVPHISLRFHPLRNVFSLRSNSCNCQSQKNCAKSDGEAGFGSMSLMSSTTAQKITDTVSDAPREPVDVFMSKMRNLSGMTPAPFSLTLGGSAGSSFMDKCARALVWTPRMTPPRNGESTRACADCRTATATRSLRRVPMFTK